MHEVNDGRWYSQVDIGEALRYAGVSSAENCEGRMLEQAIAAVNEVGEASMPKSISRECSYVSDGGVCLVDEIGFVSASLSDHLKGCDKALLFAATLGSGVDMLINRCSAVSMSRAIFLQGAAAALIEFYCDVECEKLERHYGKEGLYLRPRFSPGYGDFPLESQRVLTDYLNAYKYAGISVSGGGQMIPMKSVTAVIGLSHDRGSVRGSCASGKCAACPNISCVFRRA
jgi:Vitamin B12 dependent methionine synthase, activation domain.